LTAVEAKADQSSAQGLYKLEAMAAPGGVTARFGVFLRATINDTFTATAAEYLEIVSGASRKVIVANQTVLADSAGNVYALFDPTGAYLNNARIINLSANNIAANAITADKIAAGAITAAKIQAGTITADKIIATGISQLFTNNFSGQAMTGNSYAASPVNLTVQVNYPSKILILCTLTGQTSSNSTLRFYLRRNGFAVTDITYMQGSVQLNNGSFLGFTNTQFLQHGEYLLAGTYVYDIMFSTANGIATLNRLTIQAIAING
jgi:hypothetical protein